MRDLARARGYRLLAGLIAGDGPAIAAARDNELLAEWLGGRDDTEIMAAHYRCFGRNAFPFAGVYLDPEGLISDDRDLAGSLRRLGQLELRGDRPGARRELCDLLAWLPPLAAATRSPEIEPWTGVVDLAVELIAGHAAELSAAPLSVEPQRLVIDESDGLAEVAAGLCLPRQAGFLLTADALRDLGRQLELPTGFGSRRQRTRRLLESGAAYDRGGAAVAGLEQLAAGAAAHLAALGKHPGLSRACRSWTEKITATRATLSRMRAELEIARDARAADG